jgi:hypothetical protein
VTPSSGFYKIILKIKLVNLCAEALQHLLLMKADVPLGFFGGWWDWAER